MNNKIFSLLFLLLTSQFITINIASCGMLESSSQHCEICNITFKSKRLFIKHKEKSHSNEDSLEDIFSEEEIGNDVVTDDDMNSFLSAPILPSQEEWYDPSIYTRKRAINQIATPFAKKRRIVEGSTKYQCSMCNHPPFAGSSGLSSHFKHAHEGYRPKCEVCESEFSYPSGLAKHFKLNPTHRISQSTTEKKQEELD